MGKRFLRAFGLLLCSAAAILAGALGARASWEHENRAERLRRMADAGRFAEDMPAAAGAAAEARRASSSELSDGDSFNLLCCGTDGDGTRTDVMLLVRFDRETPAVHVTSLPRDTLVETEDGRMRLNAVWQTGGGEGLRAVVRALTGAEADRLAIIDFAAFRELVDMLGGVELDVPEDMYYRDPAQGLVIDLHAGRQVLDGAQAEAFVRYRRYAAGDIRRTENQRYFLTELLRQKNTAAYLAQAPYIYMRLRGGISTDLTLGSAYRVAKLLRTLPAENVYVHELTGTPETIDGVSYYILDDAAARQTCAEWFGGTG